MQRTALGHRRASPWVRMTRAMPSASAASVPGLIATHSSALAPVSESRGSTVMNWPEPSRRARMAAKPRAWRHRRQPGVEEVGAERHHRARRAKSKCGISARPKVRRLASRRLSCANGS